MTKQAKHTPALNNFIDASDRFRDLINDEHRNYTIRNRKDNRFSEICCGMDFIGDILLGFQNFLDDGLSNNRGVNYHPYIEIIGILNSMYIQQNIVSRMYYFIIEKSINLEKKHQEIKEIRIIRNAIAAHPMDSNGDAHFITRMFLTSEWQFEYSSHGKTNDYKPKLVDLYSLLCQHLTILCQVLERIIKHMEAEDKKYKKQFKDEKLVDTLSMHSYFAGKLFDPKYVVRRVHIEYIGKKLDEFESALLKRGKHFLESHFISHQIPMIRHALSKCLTFTTVNDDSYIYAFFIAKELKELEEIAKEIDEEYSQ